MKRFYPCLVGALLLLSDSFKAQLWVDMMMDPSVNFYTVQAEFYNYWSTRDSSEKGKGWKAFKRWEEFMAPRVYPTGDRTRVLNAMAEYQQFLQNQPESGPNGPNTQAGNWTLIGPINTVPTFGGSGRVNAVRVDPLVATTFYACTPAGGLWKSTNSGASWTMWNTDGLAAIGCTDLAIHPTNTQIMYLASGDGDAGDTYSLGVLKSTDGGVTWNTTGLNWAITLGRTISRLLIDPSNPNTVHAATSNGMYRTTDGGTTWTQVQAGNFKDAELQPGTPSVIVASTGTQVYRSTNSGASYTSVYTVTGANRLALAVTPANNQYVYVLASSAANSGFLSFHRSTNGGASFSAITVSSPSNILGWASAGNDAGGQGWYDLALAASPTNANELVAGGVNIWRTTNGGTSWTLNAHWTGSGAPYVHADIHDLAYTSGTTVLVGCDGGVFRTTNNGGSWTDLSAGLQIAQMYCLGTSATNANMNISGWQDNGTNRVSSGTWTQVIGGDGMECLIDYTNANIQYGELYYGRIYRTANNWSTAATMIVNSGGTGVNANGNWVTPYIIHPTNNATLLVGKALVYRSTNSGTSWAALGALTGGSGNVVSIAYAPSNTNYIYCAKSNAMFVSSNGGTTFTNITTGLSGGAITDIAVSATDPLRVYVTISGYTAGSKVFMSTNGGSTWTNYSTGLPNLPANTIVYQNATPDGVYVGTDVGVYYRDNTMSSWVNFYTGLPNVIVKELEIQYSSGRIRAATFGRGMWESTLYTSGSSAPIADFTSNYTSGCPGQCFNFTDLSSFTPTSWSWTFTGATPSTSTAQNPTNICYAAAGTYPVTLVATNINGSDTETKTTYITIQSAGPLPFTEGFQNAQFLPPNWLQKDIGNDGLYWQRSTTVGGYSTSTASAWFDNYNLNAGGARDEMWSPKFIFSSLLTCTLTFDVAYARYSAQYSDSMAVLVSTNCGQTWTEVWMKGGTTLATAPDLTTSGFVPTSTQWRTESINLNAYCGQAAVMIAFQNRGRWGQNLYVDNINLAYTQTTAPVASFTASATTGCPGSCFNFTDNSTGSPTSWAWSFPGGTPASSTLQNPTNICYAAAGTYTVTLTATNGSGSSTTSQTITINANPVVSATPAAPSICSGGSVVITASGASTYTWSPATGLSASTGATVTANPTATTTYTITGVSTAGCNGTSTVTVTVNPLPTITASPASPAYCQGGSVVITASGGTTYTWSPATGLSASTGATVTANPTVTTTYTITGTSAAGCTNTSTVTVTVNPNPTVSAVPASPSICTGGSVAITASGANTYTWSPATGLSATTGATVTANPTATTTYTITGTSSLGCTNTATVTVTVNPLPTVTKTPSAPTICAGGSVVITASGANTYAWSPATGLSATTGATVTANPTVTTTYTITGTSTAGCTNTTTVTVTVNPAPTITSTPSAPSYCAGGSVAITASGGTTYTWSPATGLSATTGATVTANPTATTTYTITGTAANGCTNTTTVTVTVNPLPTVTKTPSAPSICTGGSVVITASGANTYTWTPATGLSATTGATVTANPTATTTYTITGVSAAGCSNTTTVTVTVNPLPTVTKTPSAPAICAGGSVIITASGANTYTWTPATGLSATTGASVTASPTVTTTYTITGTSTAGCTNTTTVTVTVNSGPAISTTPSSPSFCAGGSVSITASGAVTYAWSPATGLSATTGASVTANPASTTTYTITGTGSNGCTSTSTVTVTVNPPPVISATPAAPSICTGGSVAITASGGNTYAWSPATGLSATTGASVTASPTTTTTYTITGTGANGCTGTTTITVTVATSINLAITPSPASICIGSSINLTATGATTYTWSPASGLSATTGSVVSANPTSTTTYTVTGASGSCSTTSTVTVTVNPLPAAPVISQSVNVLTSTPALTYQWYLNSSPIPGATSQSYTISQTGTYEVCITDANGCSACSGPYNAIFTGMDDPLTQGTFTIYPNPNNGQFTLSFELGTEDNYMLELTDALGQVVYSESLPGFSGKYTRYFDLTQYGSGVYMITLRNTKDQSVKKVIVW
ncbi:MAG: PKD domain-containing protein [Bacteroidota bacterium]